GIRDFHVTGVQTCALPISLQDRRTRADEMTGDVWAEDVRLDGADPVWAYTDGPAAGGPAVTRYRYGAGTAWYVSTRPRGTDLDQIGRASCRERGEVTVAVR